MQHPNINWNMIQLKTRHIVFQETIPRNCRTASVSDHVHQLYQEGYWSLWVEKVWKCFWQRVLLSWRQWDAHLGFRERTCHVASKLLFTVYLNPCSDTRYHSARESRCTSSFPCDTSFSSSPAFVGFLHSPICILTLPSLPVPSCAPHGHLCRSKCCCCRQRWHWSITGYRECIVLSCIVLYRAQHWLCHLMLQDHWAGWKVAQCVRKGGAAPSPEVCVGFCCKVCFPLSVSKCTVNFKIFKCD